MRRSAARKPKRRAPPKPVDIDALLDAGWDQRRLPWRDLEQCKAFIRGVGRGNVVFPGGKRTDAAILGTVLLSPQAQRFLRLLTTSRSR